MGSLVFCSEHLELALIGCHTELDWEIKTEMKQDKGKCTRETDEQVGPCHNGNDTKTLKQTFH